VSLALPFPAFLLRGCFLVEDLKCLTVLLNDVEAPGGVSTS
jgi:hypothetical protein